MREASFRVARKRLILHHEPRRTSVHFLQAVIGAIVWAVANVVYVDLKRKGIRGFTRFAAFWVGTPTTWLAFFALREGKQPTFQASPDDDDEALLREIRRDRQRRMISEGGDGEGVGHE